MISNETFYGIVKAETKGWTLPIAPQMYSFQITQDKKKGEAGER